MKESEAAELIEAMAMTAVTDTVNLRQRLTDYLNDFHANPSPDTEAQIKRIEVRLAKRAKEAAALAIAVTKFH